MKGILITIAIIISVSMIHVDCIAQSKSIKGEVVTFDSIPVINANIKVKSSKKEYKTDSNGRFELECESNDVLNISANGFYTSKLKVDDESTNLSITLNLKTGDKNATAAINNGHINNIESFKVLASKMNSGEDFSQYANVYEIIEGRISGVQVSNGQIIIRGANQMQVEPNVDNSALIVVDGAISDPSILSTLPTSLVKSVKVLKDGNTAAYGSQGANGVLLIETKSASDL